MHKNVQMNPKKSPKIAQHSCCSMLTREKIWKQLEAMDIVSSPKLGRSLPKPSCLLWEALDCEKHIPKPAPNGTKNYHNMLMLLHDSIPSFMNFRRVLDLLEFKNQVSQCLRPSDGGRVLDIHSLFLHGTQACTQGHGFDFLTNLYALEHVCVVQIWTMHINVLKPS